MLVVVEPYIPSSQFLALTVPSLPVPVSAVPPQASVCVYFTELAGTFVFVYAVPSAFVVVLFPVAYPASNFATHIPANSLSHPPFAYVILLSFVNAG